MLMSNEWESLMKWKEECERTGKPMTKVVPAGPSESPEIEESEEAEEKGVNKTQKQDLNSRKDEDEKEEQKRCSKDEQGEDNEKNEEEVVSGTPKEKRNLPKVTENIKIDAKYLSQILN